MFFLTLHSRGFDIIEIFWGLWLFPLGLLVYRSRFLPRILGVLVMLNCCTYVIDSVISLAAPQYGHIVGLWIKPFTFGEFIFMFWILIMGADPKSPKPASS